MPNLFAQQPLQPQPQPAQAQPRQAPQPKKPSPQLLNLLRQVAMASQMSTHGRPDQARGNMAGQGIPPELIEAVLGQGQLRSNPGGQVDPVSQLLARILAGRQELGQVMPSAR